MDPVWTQLPIELAEHVCNQLPKVRRVDENMKAQIENQEWMVKRMLKYYTEWFGYMDAYDFLLDDLNMLNESDFLYVWKVWEDLDPEKRSEYYNAVMR